MLMENYKRKRLRLLAFLAFVFGVLIPVSALAETEKISNSQSESEAKQELTIPLNLFGTSRMVPVLPPGVEGEVLSDIFREPIGSAPMLLSDKLLQITPNSRDQLGAIWSKEKIDLKKDFSLKAQLYLGDAGKNAADGVTFTLQNDSRMENGQEKNVIGMAGEGLAAYSLRNGGNYIRNAISIEFDTYFNGNGMDKEVGDNAQQGHVAFVTPKQNNSNPTGEHSGTKWPGQVFLSNGKWREVEFSWVAATKTLSYYMNETNVGKSSIVVDVARQFGGDNVYFGFTGSTGTRFAENAIAITQLPQKLEQVATIQNLTQNLGPSQEVEGDEGDELLVKTMITPGIYEDMPQYVNSKLKVKLAEGVLANKETITIDGQKVAANRIEQSGNDLFIKDMTIIENTSTEIIVEAQLTSDKELTVFTNYFELIDKDNKILNKSVDLLVKTLKHTMGLVTVKNSDTENNVLSLTENYGKVGTNFSFIPAKIEGYTYSKTEGSSQGQYTVSSQGVTFIYTKNKTKADLVIEFLDEDGQQLRETIIKEKEAPSLITLSEEANLQAAIQDLLKANYVLIKQPDDSLEFTSEGLTIVYHFKGILVLKSIPRNIDFGEVAINGFRKRIGVEPADLDLPLIVEDNRKNKDRWDLTAEVIQEMTNGSDIQKDIFRYVTNNVELTLNSEPKMIYTNGQGNTETTHTVSSSWGKAAGKDGLKVKNDSWKIPKIEGDYTGKIRWTLRETIL